MMDKRIDEIRKRHETDEKDDYVCAGGGQETWSNLAWRKYRMHQDRATLLDTIESAEEIMVDAVRHLSRAQMGQDNNELAGRMQEWLTEFAG